MQLTEIVQLVLVSFAVLIVVVFFVSYISYKTKKKNKKNIVQDYMNKMDHIDEIQNFIPGEKKINASSGNRIANPKFLVFNPNASSEQKVKTSVTKKHFPRILSIKN